MRRMKDRQQGCRRGPHRLVATRIGVRPPTADDWDRWLETVTDPEVMRWQGWDADAVEKAKLGFRAWLKYRGCPAALVVDDLSTGAYLGDYTFHAPVPDHAQADLGWSFHPDARGQGFARESLALALAFGHDHLGLRRIRMGTTGSNVRAIRQIEYVGAQPAGTTTHTLPNGLTVPGIWFIHESGRD